MKVAAICLALASTAQAFAPVARNVQFASPAAVLLRMSDEEAVAEAEVEAAEEEEAAPAPAPAPVAAKPAPVSAGVPCFGAAPMSKGNTMFLGEKVWNQWTSDIGSADTGTFLRAAELKHGRSAMFATVGFALQKLGVTFDKFSPHEYLSVTQNVKFSDLLALGPADAIKAVPNEGLAQIFFAIAAIEIYEMTHRDGEIKTGERVAPGLQPGGLTGDIGWNPLKIEVTDRRRLVELMNGRAAMVAICAWVSNEVLPGSFPIPLPW